MINVKKLKNLAIAAALGMVIGVQSVMPVSAAEAVPMDLVTCPNCGSALQVNWKDKTWTGKKEGPLRKCDDPAHLLTDCYIFNYEYKELEQHVCPNGHYSKDVRWVYYWEEVHRSVI